MVIELAEIDIIRGREAEFEEAVDEASQHFLNSKGCRGIRLHRSMEQPTRYRLIIHWETLEDHMVEFRNSDAFVQWRRLASPFFASTPRIEHLVVALDRRRVLDEASEGA